MKQTTEPTQILRHYRWDLDKTYLKTEFDSFRDLMRTFFQSASEKRVVPGARELLKALLKDDPDGQTTRVTFISGSPRQMRDVLTEKLKLDGIDPDAFILKPNLSNLLKLRFRALHGQVGFKLKALLTSQAKVDWIDEWLFGDDAEQDAFVYSLYADLMAGRIDVPTLKDILKACRVYGGRIDEIVRIFENHGESNVVVRRIFIHLDRRSPTERFQSYGARVVPIYNYFQCALLLYADSLITDASILSVIEAMGAEGYTSTRLANSLQDLMRRGVVSSELVRHLETRLESVKAVLGRPVSEFGEAFVEAIGGLENLENRAPPWIDDIDYLKLIQWGKYRREPAMIPGLRWLR